MQRSLSKGLTVLFEQLNKLLCFVFFICISSAAVADTDLSTQKSSKLAVVNISIIMKQSPRAESLTEEIKNKYLPREEALAQEGERLEELEASLDKPTDKRESDAERIKRSREFRERKRKHKRDYEDFRDQLSRARQDALAAVRQEVDEAINTVREKYSIDIVIDNYVSASSSVDITQAVIDYLNEKYEKEKSLEVAQPSAEEQKAQ